MEGGVEVVAVAERHIAHGVCEVDVELVELVPGDRGDLGGVRAGGKFRG